MINNQPLDLLLPAHLEPPEVRPPGSGVTVLEPGRV